MFFRVGMMPPKKLASPHNGGWAPSVGPVDVSRSASMSAQTHGGSAYDSSAYPNPSHLGFPPPNLGGGFPSHQQGGSALMYNSQPNAPWDDFDQTPAPPASNSLRSHAQGTPMEPKVVLQVHYDFKETYRVQLPVTTRLVITEKTRKTPLVLYVSREQLQHAVNDKINITYPRGVPEEVGYIDSVDRWRFNAFKIAELSLLLDGKKCLAPLQIRSETQGFLNDIVTAQGSRACLVVLDGSTPNPPRLQSVGEDINRDEILMNLVGAYHDELDLWSSEVTPTTSTRTIPWYGGSTPEAEAVSVDPHGFIHAATALVLGESKCSEITMYQLHNSKRLLKKEDALKGMSWLCNSMFRLCPPQRLNQGMLFTARPLDAWYDSTSQLPVVPKKKDDERPETPIHALAGLFVGTTKRFDDDQYDDMDLFNMNNKIDVHSKKGLSQLADEDNQFDWMTWIRENGCCCSTESGSNDCVDHEHVLTLSVVLHVSLRACIQLPPSKTSIQTYNLQI